MKDILLFMKRIEGSRGRGYSRRRPERNYHKGEIKEGSCTTKVLAIITDADPRSVTRSELVNKLDDCNPKLIDWSLFYLKTEGKIEAVSGLDKRSPLYLIYRLAKGSKNG
jgi:hypothetical protein